LILTGIAGNVQIPASKVNFFGLIQKNISAGPQKPKKPPDNRGALNI
jgi:hypothetical protein